MEDHNKRFNAAGDTWKEKKRTATAAGLAQTDEKPVKLEIAESMKEPLGAGQCNLQKEHDVQVNATYKKTMEAWWVSTHCVFPCHSNCQQAAQAEQAAALASATKASACTIQIKTYLQSFLWRLYMMPRRRPRRRRRSEKNNFKRKS